MTVLLSWLYDLLIAPLAIAYGAVYYLCARALGYGYGLLALSVLTTLILSPLRSRVMAAQDEERRLRRAIEPQLARIKRESTGEDRHQRVRRLFRRYSYHPIMSIRATWGLLLQAPFILAAYHMLSELTALRLASFWGISNLSLPDGLLGDVNLLPLLMTVFNIAAAVLTPGATRRETTQALVIAALFLALLYHAPAALLIYWTANNFLSLVSVLHQRFRPAPSVAEDVVVDLVEPAAKSNGTREAPAFSTAVLLAYALCCAVLPVTWGTVLRWRVEAMYSGASPYYFTFSRVELLLAGMLFAAAVSGGLRIRRRLRAGQRAGRWPVVGVALCAGVSAFIVYGWATSLRLRTVSGKLFIWSTLAYVLLAILAWFTAAGGLTAGLAQLCRREADRSGRMLFWPAALAIAALIALFAPMAAYLTAPEIFLLAPGEMLRSLAPYFLCLTYVFLYLWVVLPRRAAGQAGLLLACLALVGVLAALAFPPDGIVDGNAFQPENLNGKWTALLQDVTIMTAALGVLLVFAWRRAMRHAAFGLGIAAFVFVLLGIYAVFATPWSPRNDGKAPATPTAAGSPTAASAEAGDWPGGDVSLPSYHRQLFSLSPDQPNVIVFMFDMYHGGHIQRMLDDDPGLADRLPGFVWYRDTVSDGNCTLLSFPAILGGPAYTPEAINARTDGNLLEKVVKSTGELPRVFHNAGYDVVCYNIRDNLAVPSRKTLSELVGDPDAGLVDASVSSVYSDLAKQLISPGDAGSGINQAPYLLSIALFRSVPNLLRESVIDLGLFDTDDIVNKVYNDVAIPLLMPRFVTADSPRPTLKLFANMLSHNPYLLGPDSLVPLTREERISVAKSGDGHYYADRHAIILVEGIVARLRAMGVYDNTRIILVSDHDNKYDDHPYLEGTVPLTANAGKPYALLMVKDFGEAGPLRVSEQFMQGQDVPALACRDLPGVANPFPPPPDDPKRLRKHCIAHANYLNHGKTSFVNLTMLEVVGSMFSASSWSLSE